MSIYHRNHQRKRNIMPKKDEKQDKAMMSKYKKMDEKQDKALMSKMKKEDAKKDKKRKWCVDFLAFFRHMPIMCRWRKGGSNQVVHPVPSLTLMDLAKVREGKDPLGTPGGSWTKITWKSLLLRTGFGLQ